MEAQTLREFWWTDLYASQLGIDHNTGLPPVGPRPRPDVDALTPGTHLLFAQSGRIEHVPLGGYDMKKNDAKPVLHLPVSSSLREELFHKFLYGFCSSFILIFKLKPQFPVRIVYLI